MNELKAQSAVGSTRLLACPFCGLTENLRQEDHTGDDPWFAVICRTRRCGAMIGSPNSYAEAAERWNRRANAQNEARHE